MTTGPTIPHPIIDCIAHGRQPSLQEFCAVAEHIRADLRDVRCGDGKATTITDTAARLLSLRAAHAALTGCARPPELRPVKRGAAARARDMASATRLFLIYEQERKMDVASTTLAERIARALAGLDHSANGDGTEQSASTSVNETWRGYLDQADAVLRTIREPSSRMTSEGDPRVWAAMVEAAIDERTSL